MAYQQFNPIQTRTTQQTDILKMLSGLTGDVSQEIGGRMMGDPYSGFNKIQQQAVGRYNQGLPTITERFQGIRNGDNSFASQVEAGRGGFMDDLQAMRPQYAMKQREQQQDFMRTLLRGGLQPQFEPIMKERQPSGWSQFGEKTLEYLPEIASIIAAISTGGASIPVDLGARGINKALMMAVDKNKRGAK